MSRELRPLPAAYSHIYPMNEEGLHPVCFTPAYQPGGGRPHHQPVFTADQMHEYARQHQAPEKATEEMLAAELPGGGFEMSYHRRAEVYEAMMAKAPGAA